MEVVSKTHEQILEGMKRRSAEILESRERSIDFLIKIGIYTPNGELSRNYTDPNKIPLRDF